MSGAPCAFNPVADPVLTVRAVTKRFGGVVAVSKADLDVPRGTITALIGPNGAGKTTLFNVVSSLYQPTEGEVRFCKRGSTAGTPGHLTSGVRPDVVASYGIARTFQNIRLFGELSVLDNVRVGFHLRAASALDSSGTSLFQQATRMGR
jgi:branched-chain amino acid transport system ATP-binding protein